MPLPIFMRCKKRGVGGLFGCVDVKLNNVHFFVFLLLSYGFFFSWKKVYLHDNS